MFNSMLRDFEEDPFFSSLNEKVLTVFELTPSYTDFDMFHEWMPAGDPFRAHREHMRQMMRSFSEPFGAPLMPSITDGRNRGQDVAGHPNSSLALRNEHRDMSRSLLPFGSTEGTDRMQNPFNIFDNRMANVRNRMEEMHRNFEKRSTDPNTHSFSSSSVMTYSKVGNEPPKVFQAASCTRRAPGGIKETRQAVKDSESGVQKMRIGHHIREKGHVVERKYNKITGDKEMNQDFQNMDESEAQSFDDEWQQEVHRFQSSHSMSCLGKPHPRPAHQAALTGPEHPHRDQQKSQAGGKEQTKGSGKAYR